MAQDRQLTTRLTSRAPIPALVSPRAADKHRLERRWVSALAHIAC